MQKDGASASKKSESFHQGRTKSTRSTLLRKENRIKRCSRQDHRGGSSTKKGHTSEHGGVGCISKKLWPQPLVPSRPKKAGRREKNAATAGKKGNRETLPRPNAEGKGKRRKRQQGGGEKSADEPKKPDGVTRSNSASRSG